MSRGIDGLCGFPCNNKTDNGYCLTTACTNPNYYLKNLNLTIDEIVHPEKYSYCDLLTFINESNKYLDKCLADKSRESACEDCIQVEGSNGPRY